uniref:Uncharacterized protein n=1 Tax=Arundo donax TaxID=35708 RepID=A0A0A8YZU9_ARUDO
MKNTSTDQTLSTDHPVALRSSRNAADQQSNCRRTYPELPTSTCSIARTDTLDQSNPEDSWLFSNFRPISPHPSS